METIEMLNDYPICTVKGTTILVDDIVSFWDSYPVTEVPEELTIILAELAELGYEIRYLSEEE